MNPFSLKVPKHKQTTEKAIKLIKLGKRCILKDGF